MKPKHEQRTVNFGVVLQRVTGQLHVLLGPGRGDLEGEARVAFVRRNDVARSTLHGAEMDTTETNAGIIINEELARDNMCSLILQRLGEILFSCVMTLQDDPRKMWKKLHQRYSVDSTFSKERVHSSLVRTLYTGWTMQDYIVKWELMSVQLASMEAPINQWLLVTMFVKSFGSRYTCPIGTAVSAILTENVLNWGSLTARFCKSMSRSRCQIPRIIRQGILPWHRMLRRYIKGK